MKARLLTLVVLIVAGSSAFGQSVEELTRERDEKAALLASLKENLSTLEDSVKALDTEVTELTDQITPYPRWTTGTYGTIGVSLAQYSDWLSKDKPNTFAAAIGLTVNAYANLDQEKYFWLNSASVNLGWLKFDDKDSDEDTDDFQVSSDAFNLTSLFGYKLSPKLAISTLAEYRTSLLDGRFNDPGYLDIGAGITWTPIEALVVVIHPLDYNFVFSDSDFDYQSSTGAKVLASYERQFDSGIAWKSKFSTFISYESSDLSNWTWVNTFSTAVRGIGVGLDVGLRQNKQEALAAELSDNPLQVYWIVGLTYAIGGK